MTDFTITGVSQTIAALQGMLAKAEVAAHDIVTRGQLVLESTAKRQFTGAHSAGTPTTSAPGSPPDVVSGTLRRSITHDKPEMTLDGLRGHVYPTAIYGRIQELGGDTPRGYLPPRPYMGPVPEKAEPELERIAREEWLKVRP